MESDEKCFDSISNCIKHQVDLLDKHETQFKHNLTVNKKNESRHAGEDILNGLTQIKDSLSKMEVDETQQIDKILIEDSLNEHINKIKTQLSQNIVNMFSITRDKTSTTTTTRTTTTLTTAQIKNSKALQSEGVKKANVSRKKKKISSPLSDIDWKFDYVYDYKHRGKLDSIHGIFDNGKTFKCTHDDISGCYCFSRVSFGMNPNSGSYKIEIKINSVYEQSRCNVIGITCNKNKTNNSQSKHNYWYYSRDYIGWSSWDNKGKDHKNVPNGLLCGCSDECQSKNVFILSKYRYISNNHSYKKRLPHIKSGDTIEMIYDSNNCSLTFHKVNDKGFLFIKSKELNSKIINLPKNKVFYWMIGHSYKQMSVTITK